MTKSIALTVLLGSCSSWVRAQDELGDQPAGVVTSSKLNIHVSSGWILVLCVCVWLLWLQCRPVVWGMFVSSWLYYFISTGLVRSVASLIIILFGIKWKTYSEYYYQPLQNQGILDKRVSFDPRNSVGGCLYLGICIPPLFQPHKQWYKMMNFLIARCSWKVAYI